MKLIKISRLLAWIGLFAVASQALVINPIPMSGTSAGLDSLLQYQMFGRDYLKVDDRFSLVNTKGYFGSNTAVTVASAAVINPTVLVGGAGTGSLTMSNDGSTFNGNVMVQGTLNVSNLNTFNDSIGYVSKNSNAIQGSPKAVYAPYAAWPSAWQTLNMNQSIPTYDNTQCTSGDPYTAKGTNITGSIVIDLSTNAQTVIDLCLGSVSLGNDQKVFFKVKPTQILRVFVNGNFITGDRNIFGLTWDGSTYLPASNYQGTMLVYINGAQWIMGNDNQFMGSYIYNGDVSMPDRINITGQLAALGVTIAHDFSASMFKYVPFNPPVVQPTVTIDGDNQLSEANHSARTITVSLDKPAIIPVSVDYSFVWGGPGVGFADATDFAPAPTNGTLTIPIGGTTASFTLTVYDDNAVEGTESFSILLNNINGAVFPGNAASENIPMTILDNDDNSAPVTADASISILEDNSYTFAQANFPFTDAPPGPTSFTSLVIGALPAAGTLWLDLDANGYDPGEGVSTSQVIPVGSIPNLHYTPAANGNGTPYTTFTFMVSDGILNSTAKTMTVNVTPVNDPPSFAKGADQTVNEDAGAGSAISVANWATSIAAGPTADESAQTVNFIVSNDNATLFSVAPAIDASGKLTYTLATDANGTANVSVQLHDNGGTVNGGVDISAAQSFKIIVSAVNDHPMFALQGNLTIPEDAPLQIVSGFASGISGGPSNESQTTHFTVTTDKNAWFSTPVTIDDAGKLQFKTAPDSNGIVTVIVTLKDVDGVANGGVDSLQKTFTITITPVNDPPSFTKGSDVTVPEDAGAKTITNWAAAILKGPANESAQTVGFRVTAANTSLFSVQPQIDASGTLTFTTAPNQNGSTSVSVRLGDNAGGNDSSAVQTFNIIVTPVNDPPTFNKGSDITVPEDAGAQTAVGWATAISAGPTADETTTQSVGFRVTAANPSLFLVQPKIDAVTGNLTFTPASNQNGTTSVSVRLGDNAGGTDSSAIVSFNITITPVNDPPTFNKGSDVTVPEDAGAQTITNWATLISAGAANESGQTLHFRVTAANTSLFSVQPQIDAITGALTFTSALNQNGTTSVSVRLGDNAGGTDSSAILTFNINITPVNDPPTAVADAAATNQDTPITILYSTLLVNDFDVDGDVLTVVDAGFGGASHGTVSYTAGTSVTYTPTTGWSGPASFTYTIKDPSGATSVGTVSVAVNYTNSPPTLAAIGPQTVQQDNLLTVTPVATDADIATRNDTLKFTLQVKPVGMIIDSLTGVISWTPGNSMVSATPYNVTVRVMDKFSQKVEQSFTVTVTNKNDAPVLAPINDENATQGIPFTTTAHTSDIDSAVVALGAESETYSISSTTAIASLAINSTTGVITATPTNADVGAHTVTVIVTDKGGLKDTATFTLTVANVNDPPVIVAISNASTAQDAAWTITAHSNDKDSAVVAESETYSLSGAPLGMSVVPATGILSWTPGNSDVGPHTINVIVTDKAGASDTASFILTVTNVNDAPLLDVINDVAATQDIPLIVKPHATDVDSAAFGVTESETWSFVGTQPTGMTINPTTGVISWTPGNSDVGVHAVTVKVKDAGNLSAQRTFNVTVANVNDAPTLVAITNKTVLQDSLLSVQAVAHDIDSAAAGVTETEIFSLLNPIQGMNVSSSGLITWTPGNADVGSHQVILQVSDAQGASAVDTFNVSVINVNDAPVLVAIPPQSVQQDANFTYQVVASDSDEVVASAGEVLTYTLLNPPAGMTITNGKISYTPGNVDVGDHAVTVIATDKGGLADTASFTLTVVNVNDPPVLAPIPPQSVLQDALFSYTATATDPDAGDVLTYSLQKMPSGMVINPTTGLITWTPKNADVGIDTIQVHVVDASGATSDRSFVLTVVNVNDPPVISSATFTIPENAAVATVLGAVSGSDPDVGSIISFMSAGGSSHFTVYADGTISIAAPLDYETAPVESLWVAVTDGFLYDTALVTIKVTNVVEQSIVKIIKVVAGDSVWTKKVDTVWTNQSSVDVTWTRDGETVTETSPVHQGVNIIIKQYQGPNKDTYGSDTVVVLVSTKVPDVEILLPPTRPTPAPNTITESPKDSLLDTIPTTTPAGDSVYFINGGEQTIFARVIEMGKDMKLDTIVVKLQPTLTGGLNTVNYTWTDEYGNSQTGTIHVYLDTIPPIVKILKPKDSTNTTLYVVPVVWTVDGHIMDTLNMQSLSVGWNAIIRGYRDRAGNESYDTVYIKLEDNSKDIHLDLEQSLVLQDSRKTSLYYADNPPKSDELYALSLVNTQTGTEEELLYGIGSKVMVGNGNEPYPGHSGKHLGPTLRIEVKLPQMGGVDAAGNARGGDLQSLLQRDGTISLKAGSGSDSTVTLSKYIQSNCIQGAYDSLSPADLMTASLYKAQIILEVSIYDAMGQYVDNMNVTQKVDNSKYLNDGGVLTAFFEIKPNSDAKLRNQSGREYGTGAYVIRGAVKSVSTLQCDLPSGNRGDRITYGSDMLQKFGYRRDK